MMVRRPASISLELDSRGRRQFSLVCGEVMVKVCVIMSRWGVEVKEELLMCVLGGGNHGLVVHHSIQRGGKLVD